MVLISASHAAALSFAALTSSIFVESAKVDPFYWFLSWYTFNRNTHDSNLTISFVSTSPITILLSLLALASLQASFSRADMKCMFIPLAFSAQELIWKQGVEELSRSWDQAIFCGRQHEISPSSMSLYRTLMSVHGVPSPLITYPPPAPKPMSWLLCLLRVLQSLLRRGFGILQDLGYESRGIRHIG